MWHDNSCITGRLFKKVFCELGLAQLQKIELGWSIYTRSSKGTLRWSLCNFYLSNPEYDRKTKYTKIKYSSIKELENNEVLALQRK